MDSGAFAGLYVDSGLCTRAVVSDINDGVIGYRCWCHAAGHGFTLARNLWHSQIGCHPRHEFVDHGIVDSDVTRIVWVFYRPFSQRLATLWRLCGVCCGRTGNDVPVLPGEQSPGGQFLILTQVKHERENSKII